MANRDASHAIRDRFLFIVLPVLLSGVLADQTSKSWACLRAVEPRILVPGYLAAYSVPNAGIILGLCSDQRQISEVFSLLGIALASLLACVTYAQRYRGAECLASALVLAGILGNTIDRLTLGHVRDFLIAWSIPTAVFNLADLLMIGGFVALLIARYHSRRRFVSKSCVHDLSSGLMTD